MSASQDFVALDWIKADISETLERAQQSLEAVAEKGDDASSMRTCLTALHQVHGTLKMVEIEGPVMVAAEMEAMAQALMNNEVPDVGHAQELLMQTILQMPAYLERIQREQKDNPQFVRPTVNNLRVSRGLEKLDGGDHEVEVSVFALAPDESVVTQYGNNDGPQTVKKLRARYLQALSGLLKKQSARENLGMMAKVLQMQNKLCGESPIGRFAGVVLAVVEGVANGAVKFDSELAGLLKKYDALLKVLSEGNAETLNTIIPSEFTQQLKAILDSASKETPRIEAAKALYGEANAEVTLTEDVDFGPDDETLAAVSKILIEELNVVTDKLDLYVRSSNRQTNDLVELVPLMEQISSTLLVVGKTDHQQNIVDQVANIKSIEASGEAPNDDQLLDIAGALLKISADLNRLVGDTDEEGEADHFGDLDEAQATVIRETRNGLARSKDAVIEYISNDFAKDKLETLADNLRSLGSGLSIVNQQRCADVLGACSRYVDQKLLTGDVQPSLSDLDDLADAITSIDYFLERLLESTTDPYWQMVEVAESAVEKLGYSVNGEEPSAELVNDSAEPSAIEEEEPSADKEPSAELVEDSAELVEDSAERLEDSTELVEDSEESDLSEAEPTAVIEGESAGDVAEAEAFSTQEAELEQVPAEETSIDEVTEAEIEAIAEEASVDLSAQPPAVEDDDLIDDEIIEIFIEEAEEVLETVGEYLPQWLADNDNNDALTELRRAFHTLKGSGRMVGATVVGELAWAIEDMLNRVLDNTIGVSSGLVTLISEVVESLPEGVSAFKDSNQTAYETAEFTARAKAIMAGEPSAEPSAIEEEEPSAELVEEPSAGVNEEPSAEQEPPIESASSDNPESTVDLTEPDAIEESVSLEMLEETGEEEASLPLESSEDESIEFELEDLSLDAPVESDEKLEGEEAPQEETIVEEVAFDEALFDEAETAPEASDNALLEDLETELESELETEPEPEPEPGLEIELETESEVELAEETADLEEIDLEVLEVEASDLSLEDSNEVVTADEQDDFTLSDLDDAEEVFELDEIEVEALPEEDSELDLIFLEEAQQNFAVLQGVVTAGPGDVDANSVAAFHTLKGSAGMAEVLSISTIAGPMELLLGGMLNRSEQTTDQTLELISESLGLMSTVTASLQTYRSEFAEGTQFAEKIEGLLQPAAALPTFDFDIVRQLSEAEPAIEDWRVDALTAELSQVVSQASRLGQENIVTLCNELLQAYQQLENKPDEEALLQLKGGHESLVLMFDQLASSQEVEPAPDAIEALQSIDYAGIEARQRKASLVSELRAELETLDTHLADYQVTGEQSTWQLVVSGLTRLAQKSDGELVVTLELMVSLAEEIAGPSDELLGHFMNCRTALDEQLAQLADGEAQAIDSTLVGACIAALSARQNPNLADTEIEAESGESVSSGDLLPEDDIDVDVLPIFLEEAEELAESIDECVLTWSSEPDNTEHLDLLLRHLHTLKGGARLAGINSLGEFTHNFETYLIGIQQSPVSLDDDFFALLNVRQDEITRRVEIYNKLAAGTATESELASMRHDMPGSESSPPAAEQSTGQTIDAGPAPVQETETPEPSVSSDADLPEDDIDEDILPIFVEEADELTEAIDQCILEWGAAPDATQYHDDLLRHLHTLKGGARLAGINSLGEFAHNFETYLIGIQQNPVPLNDEFFASLNQQQDEITRRVEVYTKMAAGEVSDEDVESLATAPAVELPEPSTETVTAAKTAATETPEPEKPEDKPAPSAAQEMVRVSADLLEELIGMAGESNITRGRVEQQIRDFGESLQEMEETINRVRDQVRRLEIEAESRETVFRLAQEDSDAESGFDDLEMDRYTMLQEISRTLNESSSDMLDLKETLANKSRDAETLLHQQARIGAELQEGLTRTRMVPFARLIPRLRRIVRQISTEVGKSVRFDAFNVEGELDRSVLERIVAPLEHMLRNAVDHGIESTEERRSNNKPETGRISLRLSREGGFVVLTISDDGGGINVGAVRKKAIERGLMTEESNLSDHDVAQFIMHAGFSTAQKLTQISGRGVGMDVVNSEIKALGGSISIDSTLGVGSEFTIHIPFTVSINRALMVVVREEIYAVPLNTIEGIVRVSPYELEAYYQPDAPMFEYAGQPYRLAYMGKMLERGDDPVLEGLVAPLPVILARSGDQSVALQVDRVIGSREIVSKSLGPQFSDVSGVSGATVMGDGSVVVILDVLAFIRKNEEGISQEALQQAAEVEQLHRTRKVMIVDDSVTVRKVTTRLMERQGWEVTTAKDGLDAMNQLQDIIPDIVLLDIEMPKMDGFEVLKSVRRNPRLEKLPIIMITSRTGEKHKQQALELGVNQYLGKPFQEANLLSTIDEVLTEARNKGE